MSLQKSVEPTISTVEPIQRVYTRSIVDEKGRFIKSKFQAALAYASDKYAYLLPCLDSDSYMEILTDDEDEPDIVKEDPPSSSSVSQSASNVFYNQATDAMPPPKPPRMDPSTFNGVPKLKVVLDLDNTLLHAFAKSKLGHCAVDLRDFRNSSSQAAELYRFSLPQLKAHEYYIKLRPGVREFLTAISESCDLAIHTNATKEYADVIVSILDPERKFFRQRLAARDDDSCHDHRKDLDRLFGSNEMDKNDLLIVDDRKDVWDDQYHPNLLQCSFYEYFESRKDLFENKYPPNGSASSTTAPTSTETSGLFQFEKNSTFEDCDTQLLYLQTLILKIARTHREAWKTDPNASNVPAIIANERRNILSGVVCMMAGFNKTDFPSAVGLVDNGPLHRRRLIALGAKVVDSVVPEITHVLVMRNTNTSERVWKERRREVKYVHALWLAACEARWEWVPEEEFEAPYLLRLFEEKAPTRAYSLHWKTSAHMNEQRRQKTKKRKRSRKCDGSKQTGSSADSDSFGSSDPSECSDSQVSTCIPPESASHSKRSRFGNRSWWAGYSNKYAADNPPRSPRPEENLAEKKWLSTGLYSDGAEVWSPDDHVTLRYDPMQSSRMLYDMRSEFDKELDLMQKTSQYRSQYRKAWLAIS